MAGDRELLARQASGGIDGANAYAQALADMKARQAQAARDALTQAQLMGAPQGAQTLAGISAQSPFAASIAATTQQAADYSADMSRRNARSDLYAGDVTAARTLIGDQAKAAGDLIDAETKAKLAVLQAQQAAAAARSGGGGGGGGGSTKDEREKLEGTALTRNLTERAVDRLRADYRAAAQEASGDRAEAARFDSILSRRQHAGEEVATAGARPVNQAALDNLVRGAMYTSTLGTQQRRSAPSAVRTLTPLQALGTGTASMQGRISQPAIGQDRVNASLRALGNQYAAEANRGLGNRAVPGIGAIMSGMGQAQADSTQAERNRLSTYYGGVIGRSSALEETARGAYSDPEELRQEMLRQGLSQEMIDRYAYTEADLLNAVMPTPKLGESAADYDYAMAGGPQAERQAEQDAATAEQMAGADAEAAQAEFDAQLRQAGLEAGGWDLSALARSAGADEAAVLGLMQTQSPQVAQAIADLRSIADASAGGDLDPESSDYVAALNTVRSNIGDLGFAVAVQFVRNLGYEV